MKSVINSSKPRTIKRGRDHNIHKFKNKNESKIPKERIWVWIAVERVWIKVVSSLVPRN